MFFFHVPQWRETEKPISMYIFTMSLIFNAVTLFSNVSYHVQAIDIVFSLLFTEHSLSIKLEFIKMQQEENKASNGFAIYGFEWANGFLYALCVFNMECCVCVCVCTKMKFPCWYVCWFNSNLERDASWALILIARI